MPLTSEGVITVAGVPAPKGSLRCSRTPAHALYEDNAKTKPWRKLVAQAARDSGIRADKHQPLDVEITFTFDRPASVRRDLPAVKPDVDKLVRTVLDALEDAGVLVNDSQVTDLIARKRYALTDPRDAALPPALFDDALPYPGVRIRINPT